MRRLTRREVQKWFHPIRKSFHEMKSGYVDSVAGYPVTRLHAADDYARIDWCIKGFTALLVRLFPYGDTEPLERVAKRLASGVVMSQAEIDECLRLLNTYEKKIIKVPREKLKDAVLTEQIAIELEAA